MLKKFNFHSLSFSTDLPEAFDFTSETIKNIILNEHLSLKSNENFLKEINKYNELTSFLGKKRKPSQTLSEKEIDEIKDDLNNIQPKNIVISENNRIYEIEIDDKNKYHIQLDLFKQPLLIYKIFENINKIDIDLITEKLTLFDVIDDLSKYECDLYFINKKELNSINTIKGIEVLESDNIVLSKNEFEVLSNNKENINKELNLKIIPFLLVIKSLLPKIDEEQLLYENIYNDNTNNDSDLIKPDNISIKYFYYFIISKDLQKNYYFILTEARKKFIKFLHDFIERSKYKSIIIIGGPKGVGKTSTLIYFSFLKNYRVFYLNLEAFYRNKNNLKEKDLLMELSKLYGPFKSNDGGISKKEIEEYIKTYYNVVHVLDLLLTIIEKFIAFVNEYKPGIFCFIIDQISFANNIENIENIVGKLSKIMNTINSCTYLRLIICTTLNNEYSKDSINNIFNYISFYDNHIYDYYYFQNFFSKEDIVKNVLKEEKEEIKNIMEELGNLPSHFYEIKRENNIENYTQYLEKNINNNLLNCYSNDTISNILELLDLVFGEKLLSANLLRERIRVIPLKYLIVKKLKINIDLIRKYEEENKNDEFIKYLILLFYNYLNAENDKIFEKYFDFEEINAVNFINDYLEKDKHSRNLFGDFYNDYIKKNNLTLCSPEQEIYVYKIGFSMNFFQKILFDKIYNYLQKEYLIFLKLFSKGSLGGFFGVLINFLFIKNNFDLFNNKIEQFAQIERLVPYHFSIKNYSSIRKKIKFKRFKIIKNTKKRKLLNKNTYIFQNIFNSKYYDCAILLKTNVPDEYDLILIQITIKKDSDKRFYIPEHEIIISYVKNNIENEFDIKIRKAYFFYILSERNGKIEDLETKNDCEIKGIKYLSYDIENKLLNYNCKLEEGFITSTFPFHNAVSLYNFKEIKEKEINHINKLKFNTFGIINDEIFNLIKCFFKNKDISDKIEKDQFKYKDFTNNIEILKKINIPLTHFSLYYIKKIFDKKDDIYIKFIDKYYFYKDNRLEIIDNFEFLSVSYLYIISSELPLELKIE